VSELGHFLPNLKLNIVGIAPVLGVIAGQAAHPGDEYIDAVVFWQRYSLQYVLGSKVFWEEVVLRNKAGRFYVSGGVQSSDYGVPDGSLFGDEFFLASLVGRPGPGSQLPDSAAGYSNEYVDAVGIRQRYSLEYCPGGEAFG
jgi:hypothetical protein